MSSSRTLKLLFVCNIYHIFFASSNGDSSSDDDLTSSTMSSKIPISSAVPVKFDELYEPIFTFVKLSTKPYVNEPSKRDMLM